jgi:FkbM family methyltransferase
MGELEPELLSLARLPGGRATAVDVGANVGLYSLAMSRLYQRVVAFEPNDELATILKDSGLGNVDVETCGLSDRSGASILRIPVKDGIRLTGWAGIDVEEGEWDALASLPCSLERLDAFALPNVCLIKIDVEGHEAAVLRGARETIAQSRPVILVEVNDPDSAVAEALGGLDYVALDWCELTGMAGAPQNYCYVPSELAA